MLFVGICLAFCATYLSYTTRQFLAVYLSGRPDLASLKKATSLEPANANYWRILGRYYLFVAQEPAAALPILESAAGLNPHNADSWVDLSTAYQLLRKPGERSLAMERAIAAEPTNPEIAWQAANLYWIEDKPDAALQEFRVVAANDPPLMPAALERCWQIRPDAHSLLGNVLPRSADVYSTFLEFLISKDEPAAATSVWNQLAELQAPVGTRYIFGYVRFLINHRQTDQALRVWRDSANLADLSGYQPSPANLVVNGDFSLPVLNGGFDWLYQTVPGVTLAIDETETHSAQQSLAIVFDSGGLADAGIHQLIPVEPHTEYEFSAYAKTENLEGAGGPHFVLEDAFTGSSLFSSDELKGVDFWKPIGGTFTTNLDTNLVLLHLARVPANNAIRGKLWIDGVKLTKKQSAAGAE
jgi:tetratricopeptide (TPR) repeat protein